MITGGSPTLYVKDMDQAVTFYTQTLGLKLRQRWENHFAEVDAGGGLIIGLHPALPKSLPSGDPGGIDLGFGIDQPLEKEMEALRARGVKFSSPIQSDPKSPVRLVHFNDPDGNPLYLIEYKK
jgi:catechol 2,3-dioxygenase-like lactoylglutathione lyase family enzyme